MPAQPGEQPPTLAETQQQQPPPQPPASPPAAQAAAAPAGTPATPPADPPTAPAAGGDTGGDTDWKAEARKWEDRAKANSGAADKLAEYERSQMTEAQQAAADRDKLQSELGTTQADLWRLRAAVAHGLTEAQANRLVGSNADEFLTDAEALRKDLGLPEPGQGGGAGPQRPQADLARVPVDPTSGNLSGGMNEWMRQQKAG